MDATLRGDTLEHEKRKQDNNNMNKYVDRAATLKILILSWTWSALVY